MVYINYITIHISLTKKIICFTSKGYSKFSGSYLKLSRPIFFWKARGKVNDFSSIFWACLKLETNTNLQRFRTETNDLNKPLSYGPQIFSQKNAQTLIQPAKKNNHWQPWILLTPNIVKKTTKHLNQTLQFFPRCWVAHHRHLTGGKKTKIGRSFLDGWRPCGGIDIGITMWWCDT